MRRLTREKAQAWRLLDSARTIAVVGEPTAPRLRTALAYLRRVGYDVRLVRTPGLSELGGLVDLILVFGTVSDVPRLLRDAAAKRADGVWFTGQASDRAARAMARQLGLVVVNDADIVGYHQERLREAGQPLKLDVRPRRRGRPDKPDSRPSSRKGWTEAGGGGQRGGGGGRAVIDEQKMIGGRRARNGRGRAA
jgi:predicted CoA-binding protein